MVFCGKPSGSCHACRARKTRCDKIPEGCTQCKRAKRTCPGYRPAGDRIFRDESSRVAQKIKAKEDRKRSSNSPTSQGSLSGADNADRLSDAESSIEIVRQDRSSLSVSFSLAPNLEDRALAFFVYNYAIGPNEPSKGNFDRIPDLYQRPNLDETLLAAMTAVGIATYSHAERAPSLINNARYQYIKAIQFTNAALRNPEDAKKDSTLMAIQVLGIFETVTGCQQRSLKDWMEHIYGAAAVIKLRGHQQTRTPAGRRMLIQVASSLLINCVHRAIRVPEHIRDYMEEAMRQSTTPAPGSKILQIMMLLADLRASIREGSVKGPRAILGSALELDGFLLEISANVPPGWEYATITTNIDSNFIYNGRYHVYHAYWIALMWNVFRTIRIILNDIIRGALLDGFSIKPPIFTDLKYATQLQVATETLYDMQADILATVPQFIGGINLTRTVGKDPLKDPIIAKFTPVPMSGCSFLIWPLWLAGVMDNTTDAVRNFVSRVLRSIGDNQGIRQAHILADLVERNSGIQVWNDENHDRV